MTTPVKAAPMREDVTQADRGVCGVIHGLIRRELDDRAYLVAAAHRLAHTARPDAGDEDVERVAEALKPYFSASDKAYDEHWAAARAALAAMREGVDRGLVEVPADIAAHVRSLGRVEWGQTHAHDAEGHGAHVAESVRKTAETFDQTEDQHMHGLWLEGTETVLCHTGTSPNAPKTTQALVGAWNWLVDQSAALSPEQPR